MVFDNLGFDPLELPVAAGVDFVGVIHILVVEVGYIVGVRHLGTGDLFFVVDVEVDVVGPAVEVESQLVMVVALDVIARCLVFAEHEAVDDVARARIIGIQRDIVGLDFDICAIGARVFPRFIVGIDTAGICDLRIIAGDILAFV